MFKNSYFISLSTIILIFISYLYLDPITKTNPIKKNSYTLYTDGMNIKNHPPLFRPINKYNDNGKFFIHPAGNCVAKGTFTFNRNLLLKLNLSIQKGSPVGDIKFIIKKNSNEIAQKIVTVNKNSSLKIKIKRGDKLEIIADKHGKTSGDWGNFKLIEIDKYINLKNLIIPFIWSILFIFLYTKKYTYIVISSYFTFLLILLAEKLNFGLMQFKIVIFYSILMFTVTFISIFIFQTLKKLKIAPILNFLIIFTAYFIPLLFIIYIIIFKQQVTPEVLNAIFQTNQNESIEFISSFVPIKFVLIFMFIILLTIFLIYKQSKAKSISINKYILLTLITILIAFIYSNFSSLRIYNFIIKEWKQYNLELQKFKELEKKQKLGNIKFNATKAQNGETYIIIIGESLNKRHMGIYGYFRDTTPYLSKMAKNNSILTFNSTYTNYVQTMPSLSLALTEANQYNKKHFYNSLSILNIFNKAKFETYWITNQSILSSWDNLLTLIAEEADHLIPLNHTIGTHKSTIKSNYDEIVIPYIKKILKKKNLKNRVIFVHLIGNHIAYDERYPKDKFNFYKNKLGRDKLDKKVFGKLSTNNLINSYDNSVLYNDYIISKIINMLKKTKTTAGLIYFSDHGEDVIDNLSHHPSKFTYEMAQIPMIMWFSKKYIKKYKSIYKYLLERKNVLFSNDLIYDTLIGITNISTDKYSAKYDLSSSEYKLNPKDALVEHGEKHYIDKQNSLYWQKENSLYLNKKNIINKFAIDNINTIGKLKELTYNGFKSFDIKTIFKDNKLFIISKNNIAKITLSELISYLKPLNIDKLLLHIQNLDKDNYKIILQKLKLLNIDNKTTIVVKSKQIDIIKNIDNIKTAYWIYNIENNITNIINNIKNFNPDYLYFDKNIYKLFIKKIEPFIDNIDYILHSNITVQNSNFKKQLNREIDILNKKIIYIIIHWKSPYGL